MTTMEQAQAIEDAQRRRREIDNTVKKIIDDTKSALAETVKDGIRWQLHDRRVQENYAAYRIEMESLEEWLDTLLQGVRQDVQEWMIEEPPS